MYLSPKGDSFFVKCKQLSCSLNVLNMLIRNIPQEGFCNFLKPILIMGIRANRSYYKTHKGDNKTTWCNPILMWPGSITKYTFMITQNKHFCHNNCIMTMRENDYIWTWMFLFVNSYLNCISIRLTLEFLDIIQDSILELIPLP